MMMRYLIATAGLIAAAPALAQISAETKTVVTPVAGPATIVTEVAPGAFAVTPVPGVAAATKVKVQQFSDYDLDGSGAYTPMEFAQAIYFLATSDPIAGSPKLPLWDRYVHRGAIEEMPPHHAVTLLNATADEFAVADIDNDWRVGPAELKAVAMM